LKADPTGVNSGDLEKNENTPNLSAIYRERLEKYARRRVSYFPGCDTDFSPRVPALTKLLVLLPFLKTIRL